MREVIVSKVAFSKVIQIADYIEAKFSINDRNKFLAKFKKDVSLIQQNPELFPKSEFNKTRYKCVLSKFTTVYYHYNSKTVNIVSVFDTRQNPNKIKKTK
jgi:plasmid stabilization system protein ParE